ncbi:MAG: undecaprenyl/decaprenyl-phosphate alpha-N-acetylglucosaminyl 1-phosphate transferase, partial [Salinisphaera sp.]|nr:undecaprenyl/decaprenyl-phosphate alpha-N-acetylglucosaminyl 1-phosphate transferase [Salinisphaera sp.]
MEELRWQFAQGFVLAFLLIYFLLSKACRLGLVDRPDTRKRHARSVPLIGGLAIFAVYLLLAGPLGDWSAAKLYFLVGGGLLVLVGALDDYFGFPTWPRFAAQALAGLCMVAGGVVLHDVGSITPGDAVIALGLLAVPFTIFAVVGMINAANMIDGIDGLSASLFLVTIAALAVIAVFAGRAHDVHQLVILGAGIAAFLMFNARSPLRRAATAFLGDAGSMFLGFALTWFLVDFSQGAHRAMPPASAPWLMALPLLDT